VGARLIPVSITVNTNAAPVIPPPTPIEVAVPEEPAIPNVRPTPREIVGIGAVISKSGETGENMITGVVPNSPAAAAGLGGKFIIRKIDDTLAEGMSLRECVDALRGVEGTKVRLELFDVEAGEARTIELTRRKIQVQRPPPSPL